MKDVRTWLRSLGLDLYADAFEENAIDAEVLPDLVDADLESIGVKLGHRKKLLKAISALQGASAEPGALAEESQTGEAKRRVAAPSTSASGPRVGAGETATLAREAERRHLTVMFCDLVGLTALTERLDPEEYREVLVAYQSTARQAIEEFEGYIARYMGDGLLVYFGYPRAHEDDAERAIRAGRAIATRVGELEPLSDVALAVRIGIATGLVVAGDIVGEGASEERAVLGETPNLAARLQGSAAPGEVVIAEETRQLALGLFEFADRGSSTYKGFGEPLRTWRVASERISETRFEGRRGWRLTPLVGRRSELSLLLDRWERAKEGDGQVVLLGGEPGIGKSRLTQALRETVAPQTSRVLRYQCSPYHTQSAFFPIVTALEREMSFSAEDGEAHKLGKLEAMLRRSGSQLEAVLPLFAALLSVPVGSDLEPADLAEPRQRQRLIDALVGQALRVTEGGPVLSIFEDAHWMDPSTVESLTALIDAIQDAPGLVLVTCRPEFEAPWPSRDHVSVLMLTRLGRRDRRAMVGGLAGGKSLPEEVLDAVVTRTDGVPLYVEELMQSVLRGGHLRELDDRYELLGDLSEVGIPTSLQDSLLARLDRLGDAKDVAQLCATIGTESPRALVAAVSPVDDEALEAALGRLVDAEVLTRRQRADGATFTFKHALLQDAAYDSLLRATRRRLHREVAHVLGQRFPDVAANEPEVLAHHYTEAGEVAEAIRCWRQAGLRARARSANPEAIDHLTRALGLLAERPATAARDREELEMQMVLGAAVVGAQGFDRAEPTYRRALELAEGLHALPEACIATRGLQIHELMGGRVARSRRFGEHLMRLAEGEPDGAYALGGHHALGQTLFFAGEFPAAQTVLEAGVDRFDPSRHRLANWPGGQPGEQCHIYLALTLWALGFPDRARAHIEQALAHSEAGANPFSLANTEVFVAMFHFLRRDAPEMLAHAERGLAISLDYRIPVFRDSCRVMRGAAIMLLGEADEGRGEIRSGVQELESIGMMAWHPLWLSPLLDPELNPAPTDDDLTLARKAATRSTTSGECFFDAEMHRLEGEQAGATDRQAAESRLREAVDIARRQAARSLELRAARSLASLLRAQDRREEARALLEPAYSWFTEGFDTRDLREARRVLEELA